MIDIQTRLDGLIKEEIVSKEDIYVYSVDEAFLDITNYMSMYQMTAFEIAKMIMKDIFDTTKLTSACGIGSNMYLAKIALDIEAKKSSENIGYLDEKLSKLDYRMIICNGSLATYIIEEKNFDAIINLDATIDSGMLEIISRFYPVIDTTRDYECNRLVSLPIPGAEPMYEATLMAINDGNKKIGFMHGSTDSYDDKERFRGFQIALEEFGLDPFCILEGKFTTSSGYDAIKEYLWNNNELPDVLICSNDEMAIGTLDYLKKINYDLSKFKIIGFDNIDIGLLPSVKPTV